MYKIYQVEVGETLDSIANKLNTDAETLRRLNGIKGMVNLRPGSYLIVPTLDDRFTTYIVQKGDSVYSISKRYDVDPNMILKLNGLEKDSYIYPNQELLIPNKNYNFYIYNTPKTSLNTFSFLFDSRFKCLGTRICTIT